MDWLPYLLVFGGGIAAGLVIHFVANALHTDGVESAADALASAVSAPFRRVSALFKPKGGGVGESIGRAIPRRHTPAQVEPSRQRVDPREQSISDSAQTIRSILLTLTSVIKRTDEAASSASGALVDIKKNISDAGLPPELASAQAMLIAEIDRVIANNNSLKGELASSQAIMNDQRGQIEALKTSVRIDGLTSVANRAYFDEKLFEMMMVWNRYKEPFTLLMLDVDNFKTINDTYGHQAGDRVLKGIVSKLKVVLRESDFLSRYGGDEFALILIKTDSKTALDVGRKINGAVAEARFFVGEIELKTTLSIGGATVKSGDTVDSLLKRADFALYRVKESGRNGVVIDDLS